MTNAAVRQLLRATGGNLGMKYDSIEYKMAACRQRFGFVLDGCFLICEENVYLM